MPEAMSGRWPYLSKSAPVKHDRPNVRNDWTETIHAIWELRCQLVRRRAAELEQCASETQPQRGTIWVRGGQVEGTHSEYDARKVVRYSVWNAPIEPVKPKPQKTVQKPPVAISIDQGSCSKLGMTVKTYQRPRAKP